MNQLDYTDKMDLVTRQLGNGGVFLNTGSLDAPNTMTIGWGSVGAVSYTHLLFRVRLCSRRPLD